MQNRMGWAETPQDVPPGLLAPPPQTVISLTGSDASGSSDPGGGVTCSPGAAESLLATPPGAGRAGRAPSSGHWEERVG